MNQRTRLIRGWLLQQPRPHAVCVKSGDEVHTIEVGTMKWAAVATSVEALDPDTIEALNDKGKLVRAVKVDQLDESTDDETSTPEAKQEAKRAERETALITTFANLLAEAYKHSTTVAFGKMVELFEAVAKRGESLEKSLAATERLLRRAYDEGAGNKEGDEGEPSLLQTMFQAWAAGQKNGAAESMLGNTPKKTNGKAQI